MNIREMTLEDLDQVMAIEKENFSVPWTENGFFSFLIRQDTLFLVAEDETGIAGYCGIVMVPDEGDITNVSVAGNRRRQGIGAGLVRELIRRAGEAGVTKIYLEVRRATGRRSPSMRSWVSGERACGGIIMRSPGKTRCS